MSHSIVTTIVLDAPVEEVWKTLTDLPGTRTGTHSSPPPPAPSRSVNGSRSPSHHRVRGP